MVENTHFKLCRTYPEKLFVPHQMLRQHLVEVSKFRVKQRIPTLSFVNKNLKLFFRSSQISTGMWNKRCKEDEMLLHFMGDPLANLDAEKFLEESGNLVQDKQNLMICDARSKVSALKNKILGKGYEHESFYLNSHLSFHNIANLDLVRHSYQVLMQKRVQKKEEQKGFFKALGSSEWYEYVSDLIEFAVNIAE